MSFSNYLILTVLLACVAKAQINRKINAAIEMKLTSIKITPSIPHIESEIRETFEKSGVLEISASMGEISFNLAFTCQSNCPVTWTFDNMRYLSENGPTPLVFPTRKYGNSSSLPFKSELQIQSSFSSLTSNYYIRGIPLLSGKYTCACSPRYGGSEKHFYGYFEINANKALVGGTGLRSVRPNPGDEWVGLGCITGAPNAPIALWKSLYEQNETKSIYNVKHWSLLEIGENIRRDGSQGFAIRVDPVNGREGGHYRCTESATDVIGATLVQVLPMRKTLPTDLVPRLTLNRDTSEFECCFAYPQIASLVDCSNLDHCNFLADRRYGAYWHGKTCTQKGELGKCCTYPMPRFGSYLRCINDFQKPPIISATIVEDERSIAKNPEITQHLNNSTEELNLECTASSFTFSKDLHWEFHLRNGSILTADDLSIDSNSTRDDTVGVITSNITIPNIPSLGKIKCFAPLIGSEEWRSDSLELEELFDNDIGLFIIIAATLTITFIVMLIFVIRWRFSRLPPLLTKEDIKDFLDGSAQTETDLESFAAEVEAELIEIPENENNIYGDLLRLPYKREFEFPKSNFHYVKSDLTQLGKGAFGVVYRGKLKTNNEEMEDVAIKMITVDVTREKLKSILVEIKIMSYIGKHANVASLAGAFTRELDKGKVLMAVELCSQGSMKDFITAHKGCFNRGKLPFGFSTLDLIKWAGDIANGMAHLSSKKVIHVDLATRNIFMTDKFVPKIGDFGLSRRLYTREIYEKKSEECLPIQWMSLEALNFLKFSTQSDVWSYGVTLWEMFSLCQDPYKTEHSVEPTWGNLVGFLSSGLRLLKPQFATDDIYETMLECWQEDPSARPSFVTLKERFVDELSRSIKPLLHTKIPDIIPVAPYNPYASSFELPTSNRNPSAELELNFSNVSVAMNGGVKGPNEELTNSSYVSANFTPNTSEAPKLVANMDCSSNNYYYL